MPSLSTLGAIESFEGEVERDAPSVPARAAQFLALLHPFLEHDLSAAPTHTEDAREEAELDALRRILDDVQEQAHLLDPWLTRLVAPCVDSFRKHCAQQSSLSITRGNRTGRLSRLIYWLMKTRGWKTIVRFFPHEVSDLSVVTFCLEQLVPHHTPQSPTSDIISLKCHDDWAYIYVLLLWLSLVCNIPFALARFDDSVSTSSIERASTTARRVELLGKAFLDRAGMEGHGASILLIRLYTRTDSSILYPEFLKWVNALVTNGEADSIIARVINILYTICAILKNDPSNGMRGGSTTEITVLVSSVASAINSRPQLMSSARIRFLLTKLAGRAALASLIGVVPLKRRARAKGKILSANDAPEEVQDDDSEDEVDVPSSIEEALESLFDALKDPATIVRYAAAKALARLAARLPINFASQVLSVVLEQFTIHGAQLFEDDPQAAVVSGLPSDIPASAEPTWHGACLTVAEIVRRGLAISGEQLDEILGWMGMALYFDIRKGGHSIGSSVRDAAAYVIWALARSTNASANPITPTRAIFLARRLAAVSLFDREIQIRRAASAAFQEHVGRLGVFPHGIDVLRKTDFYAVSVRNQSFLIAAPQVAEHEEYRSFLLAHLIGISIRHWDPSIRSLAASSINNLCRHHLESLGRNVLSLVAPLLKSSDANDVHGSLLTITSLAVGFASAQPKLEELRLQAFKCLAILPSRHLKKHGNALILSATCDAATATLSHEALILPETFQFWRSAIDESLAHRDEAVQQAAAGALGAFSTLVVCRDFVARASLDFAKAVPTTQQSYARSLGVLDYATHPHGVEIATQCLLNSLNSKGPEYTSNVEARRNACEALTRVLVLGSPKTALDIGANRFQEIFGALIMATHDYTVDERGDVGSWIRTAAIRGIGSLSQLILSEQNRSAFDPLHQWIPPVLYHTAIAALLKQAAERLDKVRKEAGEQISKLLGMHENQEGHLVDNASMSPWCPKGFRLLVSLFSDMKDDLELWMDNSVVYPKITQVLSVDEYRPETLKGIVLSIGSKNESTRQPASDSLRLFASSIPLVSSKSTPLSMSLVSLCDELTSLGRENYAFNPLFISVLSSLELILDEDVSVSLSETPEGVQLLSRVLNLASRNTQKLKSIPRILAGMKIVILMLPVPALRDDTVESLKKFLDHPFPMVRVATAEETYIKLQTHDVLESSQDVEDLLLETTWSSDNDYHEPLTRILDALKG